MIDLAVMCRQFEGMRHFTRKLGNYVHTNRRVVKVSSPLATDPRFFSCRSNSRLRTHFFSSISNFVVTLDDSIFIFYTQILYNNDANFLPSKKLQKTFFSQPRAFPASKALHFFFLFIHARDTHTPLVDARTRPRRDSSLF